MSSLAGIVRGIVGAGLLTLGATAPALGRTATETDYTKTQTYSAALRYLRVDQSLTILEKDADAAYLIFEYRVPGSARKTSTGSIEVVELKEGVRVIVQLPKMPEYHEHVMRDALLRKLREEYGKPVARETPKHEEDEADGSKKPDKSKPKKQPKPAGQGSDS